MELKKKIYFEPNPGPERKDHKNSSGVKTTRLILSVVIIGLIIGILAWALKGNEKSSGQYPANITKEPLYCKSSNIRYSKITSTNSDNTELALTLIFSGTTELDSIFLSYTMSYDNEEAAVGAETFSHADFNRGLTASGYDVGKFDNKFSVYNNNFIVTLYAEAAEINSGTLQYFGLNDDDDKANFVMPYTLEEYKKAYEAKGYTCSSTTE